MPSARICASARLSSSSVAGGDDGVELLLLRDELRLAPLLGGGAERRQLAVEAVVAHERGEVRLGAEEPSR